MAKKSKSFLKAPFLKRLTLLPEHLQTDGYPFTLPILEEGRLELTFERPITFFIGDNGTGKSTLLEAIAKHCGFGLGGGSRHHQFGGGTHEQPLAQALRLSWLPKVSEGFFLRAESFFNFATYIDNAGHVDSFGGRYLHEQSHGQAFLAWFHNRFHVKRPAIYLLDEPEAALSPTRQLEFLRMLHEWHTSGMAQFIIATHSPIIMSYPGAMLLSFDGGRIERTGYTQTDHYRVTRRFLMDHESVLQQLFADDTEAEEEASVPDD
jgi:predicted ATPase